MIPLREQLALCNIQGVKKSHLLKHLQQTPYHSLLSSHTVDWKTVDLLMEWQQQDESHHLLTFLSTNYPNNLKQIADPPLMMFAKGNIQALHSPQIAIVGSRNASQKGLDNAYQFSHALAASGYTIISGLAKGIDGQAHIAALDANQSTIAVMGTGIDVIYPHQHRYLAQSICQQGLLLSEFPIGSQPKPYHFPRRNRLISGLSLGVLVIEASIRSGSLITAQCALEQNREVFALPQSIHNPLAKGCHALIKQGAKLVETIEDIIEEFPNIDLNPPSLQPNSAKTLETQSQNLVKFVGHTCTSVEDIVFLSKLPPQLVICQLVDLELQGLIKSMPGGYMR